MDLKNQILVALGLNKDQEEVKLEFQAKLEDGTIIVSTAVALEAGMYSDSLKMAGQVDCVGLWDNELCIIDFKTSGKFKEEYMARPWYLQMTAYALMVEELTGHHIERLHALVMVESGQFQVFSANHEDYIDDLVKVRTQYTNLYGI